jgi:hypothetical protein
MIENLYQRFKALPKPQQTLVCSWAWENKTGKLSEFPTPTKVVPLFSSAYFVAMEMKEHGLTSEDDIITWQSRYDLELRAAAEKLEAERQVIDIAKVEAEVQKRLSQATADKTAELVQAKSELEAAAAQLEAQATELEELKELKRQKDEERYQDLLNAKHPDRAEEFVKSHWRKKKRDREVAEVPDEEEDDVPIEVLDAGAG